MPPTANPPPVDPADEERFAAISTDLVAAVAAVVPGWTARLVTDRVHAWRGHVSPEVVAAAAAAGVAAAADVVPRLRELVATDLDDQRTNPLSLLRDTTKFAHRVLVDLGVPALPRDEFSRRSFPDDVYALAPASWDEVDPSLHEPGLTWGAGKAFLFKARRRAEGRT